MPDTPPPRTVELTLTDPNGQSKSLALPPGSYLLGREADCEILFPATAKTVSRHHARLTISDTEVLLEDLDSRSGVMVNGQVMRRQVLEDGDVIGIASYFLRVRVTGPGGALASTGSHPAMTAPPPLPAAEVPAAGQLAADLAEVQCATRQLSAEIAKRIVGQEAIVRAVWATILANAHCLMIGVPGLAKTYLVTTFADALGLKFQRIQFTPDLMPSDIIGSNVIQEADGRRQFEFVQGPIFTQLLLADEINRTPPKTQAALLEAMQERQVTVANRSFTLASPFCVIASQNPIEQEGTYPLPEAQQDRFMLCLVLDYPTREQEIDILLRTTTGTTPAVEPVLSYQEILRFQKLVDRIAVPIEAAAYAADLARATRPRHAGGLPWASELLDWGAGPRAGQSLLRAAKALAAMDGRPAVALADLRDMAKPVLRHRILCNYRARAQSLTEDAIIDRLVDELPEPRA
jgi:MoxR-like ATPase